MDQASKERFFTMAETYDRMARTLVPQYDFLQNEVLRTLSLEDSRRNIVIDLGAGGGTWLEKILACNNASKCYWVDYSEDFLEVAKEKLSKYGDRVTYILSSLEQIWESQVPEKADAIISMSAIHHLTTEEKQDLYRRCYEKLNAGGWFVNIDEMETIYPDAHLNSLYFWIRHVEHARDTISAEDLRYYESWKLHFDGWKMRNVDNMDKPKTKGDDIHESFLEQLHWLKDIGFQNVDLFIKYHLWCAIGGQKPDKI